MLISANSLFLIFGGWVYKTRMVGIFCHDFLTFLTLCSFIVTWRYRYRDQGKLAAMSIMPSRLKSTTQYQMDWTYQDDAAYIHKMLIWQGVLFIIFICTGNLGCFKIFNSNDIRDSQVTDSFRNTGAKVQYQRPGPENYEEQKEVDEGQNEKLISNK